MALDELSFGGWIRPASLQLAALPPWTPELSRVPLAAAEWIRFEIFERFMGRGY
jgi:hypothetical protein